MIQLIAAVLLAGVGFGGAILVAVSARKPYDNYDLWGFSIFSMLSIVGVGRIAWIAFS